ncbi:MAG: hypothetical protein ACFFD4_21210 [Candidatus Odinarchaeota archaeon]
MKGDERREEALESRVANNERKKNRELIHLLGQQNWQGKKREKEIKG